MVTRLQKGKHCNPNNWIELDTCHKTGGCDETTNMCRCYPHNMFKQREGDCCNVHADCENGTYCDSPPGEVALCRKNTRNFTFLDNYRQPTTYTNGCYNWYDCDSGVCDQYHEYCVNNFSSCESNNWLKLGDCCRNGNDCYLLASQNGRPSCGFPLAPGECNKNSLICLEGK